MFTRPTTNGSAPTGGPEQVPLETELLFNLLDQMQQLVKLAEITNTHLAVMASRFQTTETDQPAKRYRPKRDRSIENGNHRWSQEDLVIMMRLHDRGVKNAEIARLLGRTPRAISDQLAIQKGTKGS